MPFSGWEILIIALIVLVFFGYKRLPEIGRAAGEGARQLKEGVRKKGTEARTYAEERGPEAKAYLDEKTTRTKEYVSEKTPDAGEAGRTAGRHVREYRELKEEIMGTPANPDRKPDPKPESESS
jgi:sec-independent protein translocase protein TatA